MPFAMLFSFLFLLFWKSIYFHILFLFLYFHYLEIRRKQSLTISAVCTRFSVRCFFSKAFLSKFNYSAFCFCESLKVTVSNLKEYRLRMKNKRISILLWKNVSSGTVRPNRSASSVRKILANYQIVSCPYIYRMIQLGSVALCPWSMWHELFWYCG